jgi:hypothetical protein
MYAPPAITSGVGEPQTGTEFVDERGGEGKGSEGWVGKASVLDFGIFPPPPKRLCTQKPGRSIALRDGQLYVIGWPEIETGNPG